jgi:hypothetical protein
MIIPFGTQIPLVLNGIHIAVFPGTESWMVPKIHFPLPALWEKPRNRTPDGLRPGDTIFLAVGIQGPDLFVREIDDCSHE